MSKIYYNKREIPIPEGMLINHYDGRVYVIRKDLNGRKKRLSFGKATSETTMHVNDNFKELYPDLWKKYYGDEDIHPYNIRSGMYALTLAAGYKTSLYPILIDCFGPGHANAIMDFSMYSILTRTDVSQLYEDVMADELLFSDKLYSDSWYSNLFDEMITSDEIHRFKIQWIQKCKERGVTKCWIVVDGSNNNCQVKASDLTEKGAAKSKKNIDLVSYIYAVSSEDGTPLTWFVNDGSMHDSKAVHEMVNFLEDNKIETEGLILDRGFVNMDDIDDIKSCGFEYVMMLQANTYANKQMMKKYASQIRWNVNYSIDRKGIFGISDKMRLFLDHEYEVPVNLFFDGANGSSRSVKLIEKIMDAMEDIDRKIQAGARASIPAELKKYLSIDNKDGQPVLVCDYDTWQNDLDGKGFYSIANSRNDGPQKTYRIYHQRGAVEDQFMILKSMEGFDVTRVHKNSGIESKLAIAFISGIIRNEIMLVATARRYNTNQIIREINRIKMQLKNDKTYYPVANYSNRQLDVLGFFDITPESFDAISKDITNRVFNPIHSQERKRPSDIIPKEEKRKTVKAPKPPKGKPGRPKKEKPEAEETTPKRGPGRPRKVIDPNVETLPKRKPGRPKGSKNKPKPGQEAVTQTPEDKPKRGPGRPKGSRNKPKPSNPEEKPKRGPGRPKGSRNKPKPGQESKPPVSETTPKRGPGRPKGSRNKPKPGQESKSPVSETLPKRGPGRPKGSRNKPKE